MRTIPRIMTVAAATTALALGAAGAASAERTTNSDRAGDVYAGPSGEGETLGTEASRASGVDLKSVALSHGTDRLGITAKFYRLNEGTQVAVLLRLNGKKKPTRVVVNVDDEGDDKAVVFPYQEEEDNDDSGALLAPAASAVKDDGTYCNNQPASVDLGKNGTVSMSIDRFCLGYPKSLRAAVISFGEDSETSEGQIRDYLGTYETEPETASDLKYTKSLSRG